jgi:CO/xanthine dehydrogenase FAD-binding subunit
MQTQMPLPIDSWEPYMATPSGSTSPQRLQYVRASTLQEALTALRDGLVPLAGGTVITPTWSRVGIDAPGVVDICSVQNLRGIEIHDGSIELGATTTIASLAANGEIYARCPALTQAAQSIGNPSVRRVATVGGNVALRTSTADLIPALLVLQAQVDWATPAGDRSSSIDAIITEGLPQHSLITRLRLSYAPKQYTAFAKFGWRRASAKSIIAVAVCVACSEGVVESLRLSVAGLGPHACRLPAAEGLAVGQRWTDALIDAVARAAANEPPCQLSEPPSEAYRRQLVVAGISELLKRADT